MTWLNTDLNKTANALDMDVIKFTNETPYTIAMQSSTGTTIWNSTNMPYKPILLKNKQVILGNDFLPTYDYSSATTNNIPLQYFNADDLQDNYYYIFEGSISYKGMNANKQPSSGFFISYDNSILDLWKLGTAFPSRYYISSYGLDYWVEQLTSLNYTSDLIGPETLKFVTLIDPIAFKQTIQVQKYYTFSFAQNSLPHVSSYPTGSIEKTTLTIKRIRKS